MKKAIFIFLFSGTAAFAHAQATDPAAGSKSLVHLGGTATRTAMPDRAVFTLDMGQEAKTEAEATSKLNDLSNKITALLKKEGFSEKDIKMNSYAVNKVYDYVKNEQVDRGYSATQQLTLSFALDKTRVLKLYTTLTGNDVKGLNLQFGTESSDSLKKAMQKELMVAAVHDARQKAELLAGAAGYKIGAVATISYNTTAPVPSPVNTFANYRKMSNAEQVPSTGYYSIAEQVFTEEVDITYIIDKQ